MMIVLFCFIDDFGFENCVVQFNIVSGNKIIYFMDFNSK